MKILFLCTQNACRSILAESIARKVGGKIWDAASAGSQPAGAVHPSTLDALETKGISTSNLSSNSWEDLEGFAPDIVITVCDQAAGETCPVWFGKAMKGHWGLPDPSKIVDNHERERVFGKVIHTLETRLRILAEAIHENKTQVSIQALIETLGEQN